VTTSLFGGIAGAFVVALVVVRWLASSGASALDTPNERSLHARPTPRTGGVGIVLGAVLGIIVITIAEGQGVAPWLIAGLVAGLGAFSFADDVRGLPVSLRLSAHLGCGIALVASGLTVNSVALPWIGVVSLGIGGAVITVLCVAWMINLYNFMDGMDGLASGMAVIGFSTLGAAGALANAPVYAAVAFALAAAALGCLVWSFPPARIFMGDVGSTALGVGVAGVSLWGIRLGLFGPLVPMLAFLPFIGDATWTLVRRFARGEKIWLAHRSHFYQRAVLSGLSQRAVVLLEYLLMLLCGVAALTVARVGAGAVLPAILWCGTLILVGAGAVLRRERQPAQDSRDD
jgi:UDP-N-acetylmuramyl pentapeptide phosphotransferase/UDP-N-acetylglucosamine-1-phosphate transferase